MAVTYSATIKSARMAEVITAIDGGGGAGKLEIGTAGMAATLATITLPATSFVESGGVITLQGVPLSVAASGTGTAAAARFRDFANADCVTGLTVGTGSEDIVLNSVAISSGQDVEITSGTITHG